MSGDTSFQALARVGRFRLISPLGEGAMGRVWRAEGPSGPVAIKALNLDSPEVRERFEREARALLKLRHPNVVRAIDYGHADDGTPYMAMELLEGESLEARMERLGRLPVDEVVAIACAAAAGLAAAHALGIVHRDVKPGNLFLTDDGGVKVLDFGIAFWSENDGRAPPARITQPGMVMGTPSYMAPEQAMGDRDEDVRTDVWGLGAVVYHALAGREPFFAAGNYLGELTRILTEPPDPLPEDVPAPIAAVVLRALTKPRDERFTTMEELLQALLVDRRATPPPRMSNVEVMGALSEEVRLVTAALFEGLSPEAQPLFLEAVKRHGGVGSPIRGQRAVAIFGGDAWHGDEAERAVKMALEIKSSAAGIGIGTGKAVRRIEQRGVVTGEAIAAAQQALASAKTEVATLRPPPGDEGAPAVVRVCPDTARRLQGGFTLVGLQVVGVRPGGRMLRPREVAGREVPFVGRDGALDGLIDRFEQVDEEGRAAAVVISGPPGIGKSRLRFELMRWLADERVEVRQLEARGELAQGRSSFGVLRELLRNHAGLPEGSDPGEARATIEGLVADAGLDAEHARGTAEFVGELLGVPFAANPPLAAARADPRLMNDRIRLACVQLFEAWTRQSTVLVSIEDAQWVDAASLGLLESLLAQLAERPLCLVVTARPTMSAESEPLAAAERIELGELPAEAIARIVESILGRTEAAVVERAAGNPYLAEELSLAVHEGADPGKLPLTVEGTVLARLDRLSPDEKDLLKRAAVLGRRFWREALEELGEPLAGKLLGTLRRRELVVPSDDSRLDGCDEWLFRQAIVYEVCCGLLTDEQQRRLHRAAASWLSHRADAPPDEVAHHFERASEYKRATVWWLRATHAAHARGDSRDVVAFSNHVLALSGASGLPPSEAFAVRMLRCEALHWMSDRDELEKELRALSVMTETTETLSFAALAELRRWQAEHVQQSGHLEPAEFAARQAVKLADQAGSLELRVRARATMSALLCARGALDEAVQRAKEALELAKQGAGSMIRASAAAALAHVESERGHISATLFYYGMARNLCLEVGGLREATRSGIGIGAALSAAGDYEQARRMLDKTLETAESLDLGSVVGWVKHHLGLPVHRLGDAQAGLHLEEQAVAIARALDDMPLAIAALQYRATMQREAGDPGAALESADRALEACARHGVRSFEPFGRTVRAQALVDLGRHAEALEECERAAAVRDEVGGMLHSEVALLLARHDALAALGRSDEAARALRVAKRCFEARLATIEAPLLRATYRERVPAHARLAALMPS